MQTDFVSCLMYLIRPLNIGDQGEPHLLYGGNSSAAIHSVISKYPQGITATISIDASADSNSLDARISK